jgi:CRP/FNR family transcriptional regulator, cyclic AMP receptor protein
MATPARSLSEKLGLLTELELFRGLSEEDIEAIGHATTMTFCAPGQVLLSPDDPPEQIHIVKKGKVRAYRVSPEGRQLTLDIYDRGTILGDMRMLGQDRLPEAYVEAVEEGVICTISPEQLRRLIERYPPIGVNIISHLATRLQEAERELEAMAFQRVGQRLARKQIDLGQRFGARTVRGTLIQARLTQQELADMVGTTRETLAHTIGEFRRRGLVTTERQRIVIQNAEELLEIAEGEAD